jgi:hypothetical protein
MALGTSFLYGGAEKFLYNFIVDLRCQSSLRRSWWREWDQGELLTASRMIEGFEGQLEEGYEYLVADVAKQDTSIMGVNIDEFFEWVVQMTSWGNHRQRQKATRYLNWVKAWGKETGIGLPDGRVIVKRVGNISGWPLTTLLNSFTACRTARAVIQTLYPPDIAESCALRVYGDNILMGLPRGYLGDKLECKKAFCDRWNELGGQVLKDEDTYVCYHLRAHPGSDPQSCIEFLKRRFARGGGTWRTAKDVVGAIVAPEDGRGTPGERYSRALAIRAECCLDPVLDEWLRKWLNYLENFLVGPPSVSRGMARALRYQLGDTGWEGATPLERRASWYLCLTHVLPRSALRQSGLQGEAGLEGCYEMCNPGHLV